MNAFINQVMRGFGFEYAFIHILHYYGVWYYINIQGNHGMNEIIVAIA